MTRRPAYRPYRYPVRVLLAFLAVSFGMGTAAVSMLPRFVATGQWFPAATAGFVVFVSTIGAGVSIVELLDRGGDA